MYNVNLAIQVNHNYVATRLFTWVHSKVTKHRKPYKIFHKLHCKSKFIIYLMECSLCKVQHVGKADRAFNITLNNHRRDVNNPKSIPADLNFIKPWHSFNLHAKFTLIEQLSNTHTTDKDISKFQLKCHEDFWV